MARVLAVEPEVLLRDEPAANLDPAHIALVEEAVAMVRREHGTCGAWLKHSVWPTKNEPYILSDRGRSSPNAETTT